MTWQNDIRAWLEDPAPRNLQRGHEYAAYIVNALEGGEPFSFNGNVANKGYVTNLPQNACVEVPVWASRKGLEPVGVGRAAAPVRGAHQPERADRGNGGGGRAHGRSAAGLPGHLQRPVDGCSALAG